MTTLAGDPLPEVARLSVRAGEAPAMGSPCWTLAGVAGHLRYTRRDEAAALAQDERRCICEEQSRHTSIGMEYLPQIARRLHHGRDLGEPFDFLTWFDFAREDEGLFDELLARLRAGAEWTYVTREIDIRLTRTA